MSVIINNDLPITSGKEDLFGRCNLANSIADSILNHFSRNTSPICIGIFGKWGTGKTSVLNLIKETISKKGIDDKGLRIIDFNPWNAIDVQTLWDEFFKCFAYKQSKSIKSKIVEYGRSISKPISLAAGALVGNIVKNATIGEYASESIDSLINTILSPNKETITKQKEAISRQIIRNHIKNVVFIDDLDRLDVDELRNTFRLIRQIADFSNTVYIIGMDPEIVSSLLGRYYSDSNYSGSFIDKIVQIPILIPEIKESTLRDLLKKDLIGVIHNYQKISIDDESIEELVDYLTPMIKTNRERIRFINQIRFDIQFIYEEVNLNDFILLELIKNTSTSAYSLIFSSMDIITRKEIPPLAIERKKFDEEYSNKLKGTINTIVECYSEEKQKYIERILVHELIGIHYEYINDDQKKKMRSPNYFTRYFTFMVEDSNVSDVRINELESMISTPSAFGREVFSIIEAYGFVEFRRVITHIIEIEISRREREKVAEIAKILATYEDYSIQSAIELRLPSFISFILVKEVLSYNIELFKETVKDILKGSDLIYSIRFMSSFYNDLELPLLCDLFSTLVPRLESNQDIIQSLSAQDILVCITIWEALNKERMDGFILGMTNSNCLCLLIIIHRSGIGSIVILENKIGEDCMSIVLRKALAEKKDEKQESALHEIVMNTKAGKDFITFEKPS